MDQGEGEAKGVSHTCVASNLDPEMVPQGQGHFRARVLVPLAAGTGAGHSGQIESKERFL